MTNQYLGGDASLACSADTQNEIDRKVVELVKREHEKAKKILLDNRPETRMSYPIISMKRDDTQEMNLWQS